MPKWREFFTCLSLFLQKTFSKVYRFGKPMLGDVLKNMFIVSFHNNRVLNNRIYLVSSE